MPDIMIRDTELKVTDVLHLIAAGYSYKQILENRPTLTLGDIMLSAQVAEDLLQKIVLLDQQASANGQFKFIVRNGQFQSLDELKRDNPRAFEKWSDEEEDEMVRLFKANETIIQIARHLKRSYGSIRLRLIRLGLMVERDRSGQPSQAATRE